MSIKKIIQGSDNTAPGKTADYWKYIAAALVAMFIYVFVMNAWVTDDAYISFRTLDNFLNGYGLTWNVGERVQAYTHPLWLMLHIPFYFICGEVFFLTITLSLMLCFLVCCILVYRVSTNLLIGSASILMLIMSKAFIDYSSSGLENPLSFFLLALFYCMYFRNREHPKILFRLGLIASLALVTRMDTILLYLPVLFIVFWNERSLAAVKTFLLSMLPFIIWEIFSIIYYGFPFPNTAYAKLGTGLAKSELIGQGLLYFQDSLICDPVTLIIIISVIVYSCFLVFRNGKKELLPLVIGISLYLVYIVWIGGDFMSGRFFALPLLAAGMIFSRYVNMKPNILIGVASLIVIIGLVSSNPPIFSGPDYGSERTKYTQEDNPWSFLPYVRVSGIADERAFYYPDCGLLPVLSKGHGTPTFDWADKGRMTKYSEYQTLVTGAIGYFAYYGGPELKIIDFNGLSDPLLARLPMKKEQDPTWRIGHFERDIPAGYFESVEKDSNLIEDPDIARYYNDLRNITRGSLFSAERISGIIRLNFSSGLTFPDGEFTGLDRKLFPEAGDSLSLLKYYARRAKHYEENGEFQPAVDFTKKITDLYPRSDSAYLNLGVYYLEMGRPDEAIAMWKHSHELNSRRNEAVFNIIKYYLDVDKLDSAFYYSEKIIESGRNLKDLSGLFFSKANACYKKQQDRKAAGLWEITVKIDPDNINAHKNLLLYYLYISKDYKKARETADTIIGKGGQIEAEYLEALRNISS